MTTPRKPATEIQTGDTIDLGWTQCLVSEIKRFKTVTHVYGTDMETGQPRSISIRATETVSVVS